MNSQYWLTSGRSRPHSWCRKATAFGVAWIPSIVLAGSPGIKWIMKKTTIVTPIATGISISRRWKTNVIRPNGSHLSTYLCQLRACGGSRGSSPWASTAPLLTEPDVLHVHVAERCHEEAVHVARRGVWVRRVVQEGHERVSRRVGLHDVVERLASGRVGGLLRGDGVLDHRRVVVEREEGARATLGVDSEVGELIRVRDVHRPQRQHHVVLEVLFVVIDGVRVKLADVELDAERLQLGLQDRRDRDVVRVS